MGNFAYGKISSYTLFDLVTIYKPILVIPCYVDTHYFYTWLSSIIDKAPLTVLRWIYYNQDVSNHYPTIHARKHNEAEDN